MSGKVWTLITAVSFITYIHDVQSGCMPHDVKAHLDDLLLEEHVFEIKVFSPETKEHKLLSVINTLCSTWTNNKFKDMNKLKVLETFQIMLYNLDKNFTDFCANLNCTDAYTVRSIDTNTFGEMYKKSCDGSVSDLKCPSKSTTINPTTEFIQALKDDNQNLWAAIKTCSGLLVVSFLLNIVLLLMVVHVHRNSKKKTARE
ncbi:uncharacterized protein LOC107730773 isoform X3 [Sinocyclocheilus rhinocerous]|uniref:uncharacterized protein LOC107730773 isoform X3 n=1 Tax=Sinocyclocheilus rhinocerous TaxID=307959 RepID=UPI0007BA0FA5|nr:PREDICTED: uncharacterized protein LOC107730773 isoform X3 [Sinocyclocheilus rhinocerous]